MTADDLRTQKALAMLEATEARQASRDAEADYGKLVAAIGGAHNALSGFTFSDTPTLRNRLEPFASMVNVNALADALEKSLTARAALREATNKLKEFKIDAFEFHP